MAGHVLITGASAGIGASLAVEIGRRGRAVGLVARRAEALQETAARVNSNGGKAAWATADVSDEGAMAAAVQKLEAELGPCDAMIANAGVHHAQDATEFDPDAAVRLLKINIEGAVVSAAVVLPGMLRRGRGHLILMSSVAAFYGTPQWAAYCASKAAATSWWESMRVEVEPRGLTVSSVHPAYVETDLVKDTSSPMPFIMKPEYLAGRVADLLDRPKRFLALPWQMAIPLRQSWWMPGWLVDPMLRRFNGL